MGNSHSIFHIPMHFSMVGVRYSQKDNSTFRIPKFWNRNWNVEFDSGFDSGCCLELSSKNTEDHIFVEGGREARCQGSGHRLYSTCVILLLLNRVRSSDSPSWIPTLGKVHGRNNKDPVDSCLPQLAHNSPQLATTCHSLLTNSRSPSCGTTTHHNLPQLRFTTTSCGNFPVVVDSGELWQVVKPQESTGRLKWPSHAQMN